MTANNAKVKEAQVDNFICPNCGGGLQHNMKKDKFLCTSCGYEGELHTGDNTVDEKDFDDYKAREAQSVPFAGLDVASCQNCGSQVTYEGTAISTICPMCGSAQISKGKQKMGIPPEGVIPFKVDKKEAEQKFKDWVKRLWFAPNKLKKSYQAGNLVGRFVPFWTYDADGFAGYTGQGGRYRTVKDKDGKEHTETDWFPTSGTVKKSFDDILVVASNGQTAQDAKNVAPFDTINGLRPYAPEYLAGYQAELYSIRADAAFETAKNEMKASLLSLAESDIHRRFDTARSVCVTPNYTSITYKHVLLPVWGSLFSYGGKTYRYVVNGATGNVYGQRPYSIPKIVAAVVVSVAIIMGVATLFMEDEESAAAYDESGQQTVVQTTMGLPSGVAYTELTNRTEL